MTPEEYQQWAQQMMAMQMALSQQPPAPQQNAPADARAEAIAAHHVTAMPPSSGNPALIGNDALRQQFAADPTLAPPNASQWLDDREQHLLGNDAPPIITATAPAAAPPPMLPPQMPTPAPQSPVQSLPQVSAPQQPPTLQALPQAPAAALPPPPLPAPPVSAPMLPPQPGPASIQQLPQQAPVMSQVSPAPKTDAHANIDNSVTGPTPSFASAYQQPALPSFLGSVLTNPGPYKPAPSMPGYAMPRTGSPFRAPRAPQLPSFDNPFAGPGGLTASYGAPTLAQQPYGDDLYSRLLMPRGVANFY